MSIFNSMPHNTVKSPVWGGEAGFYYKLQQHIKHLLAAAELQDSPLLQACHDCSHWFLIYCLVYLHHDLPKNEKSNPFEGEISFYTIDNWKLLMTPTVDPLQDPRVQTLASPRVHTCPSRVTTRARGDHQYGLIRPRHLLSLRTCKTLSVGMEIRAGNESLHCDDFTNMEKNLLGSSPCWQCFHI